MAGDERAQLAAEAYDRGLGPVMFAAPARRLAHRLAELQPWRLLETAAGSGIATRAVLAAGVRPALYHVTDLNPAMLALARAQSTDGDGLTFDRVDALALPFADGHVDTVICQFGWMFFPDKDKALREARRVLAPGGRLLFSVWDALDRNPHAKVLTEAIQTLFPMDPPRFFETPHSWHSVDTIRAALQRAGFGEVRISVCQDRSAVSDYDGFARGFVERPDFAAELDARMADPVVVRDKVAKALAEGLKGETMLRYLLIEADAG